MLLLLDSRTKVLAFSCPRPYLGALLHASSNCGCLQHPIRLSLTLSGDNRGIPGQREIRYLVSIFRSKETKRNQVFGTYHFCLEMSGLMFAVSALDRATTELQQSQVLEGLQYISLTPDVVCWRKRVSVAAPPAKTSLKIGGSSRQQLKQKQRPGGKKQLYVLAGKMLLS